MRPRGPAPGVALNWGLILPVLGAALLAAGTGMTVSWVAALAYGDGAALAFGVCAAVVVPLGAAGLWVGQRIPTAPLRARDGYVAVTGAWGACACVGAVPFLLHGTFTSPIDALFESMSGFTGCGGTMITDVDAQPHAILLWRGLTHFTGGVGIVLLVVAVAPATGLASQRLFFTESSAPTTERLTPRIADTAKIIWGVYATLTVVGAIAFWVAGMGLFDAVNHTFTAVGTGGFSTRTASLAAFDSLAVELVAIVLMVLAGISFVFYWRALRGLSLELQLSEVRAYLLLLGIAIGLVTASVLLAGDIDGFGPALRASAFSVVSLSTTTGLVTADFDRWNDFARLVIVSLTFVGACAGSTSGGMKVVRVLLLARTAVQEAQRQLQPQAVQVLRMPGRVFSEDVRRTVLGYFFLYITVWAVGTLLLTATGLDILSAATSASSGLNLSGVGINAVGAAENWEAVPPAGRFVMSVLMLIGRLEIFTVVALLTPAFWRRQWQ